MLACYLCTFASEPALFGELIRSLRRKGDGKFDLPRICEANFHEPPLGPTFVPWTNVNKMDSGWRSIYRKFRGETANRSDNCAATSLPEQACGCRPYRRSAVPSLLIKPEWRPLIGVPAPTPIKTLPDSLHTSNELFIVRPSTSFNFRPLFFPFFDLSIPGLWTLCSTLAFIGRISEEFVRVNDGTRRDDSKWNFREELGD